MTTSTESPFRVLIGHTSAIVRALVDTGLHVDLCRCVSEPKIHKNLTIDVLRVRYQAQCTNTVSIGATLMHEGHHNFDDLCRQADAAMYEAKKAGRNAFRMFVPTMLPA